MARPLGRIFATSSLAVVLAGSAGADVVASQPSLNFWGVSGLIDMPSAEVQTDGGFDTTVSSFAGITRTTLSFQISPRLSGSFRYSSLRRWNAHFPTTYYDRSFDLRYQIFSEGRYLPAFLVGVQDFVGTDLQAAEYLVATKHITPGLKFTLGLGWGRLGSYGSIGNTFGSRPHQAGGLSNTGQFHIKQWFHGAVAPFGGVEWQASNRLRFKLEYSSDAYTQEVKKGLLDHRIPWNAGVEYDVNNSIRVGLYELYGSKLGFSLQLTLDPKTRPTGSLMGPGPVPVAVRPSIMTNPDAWSTSWTSQPDALPILRDNVATQLAAEGLTLQALSVTADTAELRIINTTFDAGAQAIGRAARVLTQTMPASVETFRIVPVVDGIPISTVIIKRTDIENREFAPNGDASLRAYSSLTDAGPLPVGALRGKGLYPHLAWSLGPYTRYSLFDPDNPLRIDVGLRLSGTYTIAPGLILSGSVTQKAFGNLNTSTRASNSVLPHVRSDASLYDKTSGPQLETLTGAWYSRPGPNLYGRVTVGYLEQMYGGVSGEVLWQRPSSRFALGAELDYARQRDYNGGFGFRSYGITTGFVSAYYKFNDGYFAQIDAGRYLAGDTGATLTLSREFANGWRVGAFATKTNVSAADFGEGSFDKGIFFNIPLNWAIGSPTQASAGTILRPVQRDGGAMLNVDGRLYDVVRAYHSGDLYDQWGRVFR
ncbi:MAG: YjbH domain-containing protein [Rhodobacteraceae bacterium]|nr:YjbH domain-containing protein [Paracoccaceae bacterium]